MKAVLILAFVFLVLVNAQDAIPSSLSSSSSSSVDTKQEGEQIQRKTQLFKSKTVAKKQDKRAVYENGYDGYNVARGYPTTTTTGFGYDPYLGYNNVGYNPAFSGINSAVYPNAIGYNSGDTLWPSSRYNNYNRYRSSSGYYNTYNPYSTRVIGLNRDGRYNGYNYGGYYGGYRGHNYPYSYSSGVGYNYGPGISGTTYS